MTEKRDREIYDFVVDYVLTHGYAPSIQEIVEGTSVNSKSTVFYAMQNLFAKGLLETDIEGNSKRAFRVKELEIRRRF